MRFVPLVSEEDEASEGHQLNGAARPSRYPGMVRAIVRDSSIVVLAGCGLRRSGPPAPVVFGDPGIPPIPPVQEARRTPPAEVRRQPTAAARPPSPVGAGTTRRAGRHGLTRRASHGVDLRELIETNRLQAPFSLSPGQRCRYPSRAPHGARGRDEFLRRSRARFGSTPSLVRSTRSRRHLSGRQPDSTLDAGAPSVPVASNALTVPHARNAPPAVRTRTDSGEGPCRGRSSCRLPR